MRDRERGRDEEEEKTMRPQRQRSDGTTSQGMLAAYRSCKWQRMDVSLESHKRSMTLPTPYFLLWVYTFFLIFKFFWCGKLKIFIEFVAILLLCFVLFCFFGFETCGILDGEVLTIGPPRKSLGIYSSISFLERQQ